MIIEQVKDKVLLNLKEEIQSGMASSSVLSKHIILDILFYLSKPDTDPIIRLYLPRHIIKPVIMEYHQNNGHMGIDKTHDAIKHKYYWPNMYKELCDYINNSITCQTRNLTKVKPPQQETDAPPYPFAMIGLDVAGPYHKTLSGNKYVVGFVDWYSGWTEAFPVPDKSADTIEHLLLEEIIPIHSTPLQLVTDNGTGNVNKVMQHLLQTLDISHITTYYHPQSNSEVEGFHRTFNDVMSKKVNEHLDTWDLYISQVLAAIRFNTNESNKFSTFYLLYNREPVMPIDNILKPR